MIKQKNRNYTIKQKSKKSLKSTVLFSIIGLLLVAGGLFAFMQANDKNDSRSPTSASSSINLDPATETDKQDVEENKDRLTKDNNDTNTTENNDQKKAVQPLITQATRGEVRAYVTGVFEDGGTCTAKFTQNNTTLTKSSEGFQNVSYTQCAPIELDSGFLGSGMWSVTVSYQSSTAQGTSDVQYIE